MIYKKPQAKTFRKVHVKPKFVCVFLLHTKRDELPASDVIAFMNELTKRQFARTFYLQEVC